MNLLNLLPAFETVLRVCLYPALPMFLLLFIVATMIWPMDVMMAAIIPINHSLGRIIM